MSSRQLGTHEFAQATDRSKGRGLDFVISHTEAKAVFNACQDGHNCHRIKLGNAPEQRRRLVNRIASVATQHRMQNGEDFFFDLNHQVIVSMHKGG